MIYEKKRLWAASKNVPGKKLLLSSIALTLWLLFLPTIFSLLPTTHVRSEGFEQKAHNQGVRVTGAEKLCYALSEGEEIKIHISGSLTEMYNYQNLFQTSGLNAGIRFEIDVNGQGGLVIGNNSSNGYFGLVVPARFEKGKFDLLIRIIDGRKVLVSYSGQDVAKDFEGLRPKCNEIIAGYGYDSSRVIKGNIKFVASASYLKPRYVPIWLDDVVRLDWYRALAAGLFLIVFMHVAFKLSVVTNLEISEETDNSA